MHLKIFPKWKGVAIRRGRKDINSVVNTRRYIIILSPNDFNHNRSLGFSLKCEEYMGTLLSRLKFPGSKGKEPYITLTIRGWIQAGDLP